MHNRVGYMFIVPAVIFMLLFVGYPIIYNILLSLQDVNVMTVNSPIKEFVGFKNYIELFKSSVLLVAIGNTLYYTVVCIIFQFVLGFAFALFFNIEFTFSKFIRGLVMVSGILKTFSNTRRGCIKNIEVSTNISIQLGDISPGGLFCNDPLAVIFIQSTRGYSRCGKSI